MIWDVMGWDDMGWDGMGWEQKGVTYTNKGRNARHCLSLGKQPDIKGE
jgi:hypothetical protein